MRLEGVVRERDIDVHSDYFGPCSAKDENGAMVVIEKLGGYQMLAD